MTQPYIDQIFASYQTRSRGAAALTKDQWLDGRSGWRSPLRQIGEYAAKIVKITDIKAARYEWALVAYNNIQWVRNYLETVPLLDSTTRRADHNDTVFRQFMKDLATLADL